MTSKIVPTATKIAITTTNVCMTVDGMEADSSANGLLVNIARRFLDAPRIGLTITDGIHE
jgi:hypothetical protein